MAVKSIIVDGQTITPEPEDFDGLVAELDASNRPFEYLADTETFEVEGVGVGAPAGEQDLVVENYDEDLLMEQDAQLDEEIGFLEGVKRATLMAQNQRPDVTQDIDSGAVSPMNDGVYNHFEPSVASVLKGSELTDEDRADIEASGKDSEAYKAIAQEKWMQIVDVHNKHGLPAIRVNRLGATRGGAAGYAAWQAENAQNIYIPMAVAYDQMAMFGAGRHAMGVANDETVVSPAVKELQKMHVISPTAERLKEIAEDGPALPAMVGAGLGMFGGAGAALAKGVGKLATKMGGGFFGQTAAAGAGAAGELAGEESVEAGAELARGKEVTLPSAEEAATRLGMGMLPAAAISSVSAPSRAMYNRLRGEGKLGMPEMAQIETLTGKRGTSMTGPSGVRPGEKAQEMLATDAAAYRSKGELADSSQNIRGVAKKVGEAINKRADKLKVDQMLETDMFYMTPEGSTVTQRIDSIPAMLKAELGRRQIATNRAAKKAQGLPGWVNPTAQTIRKGGEKPAMRDAPLMDNKQIEEAIKKFEGFEEMTAQELDITLKGVDELMRKNRKTLASNQFLKNLQFEMRKIRDGFQGNFSTDGRTWGKVKEDQHAAVIALENAKRRAGQQVDDKIDVSNDDSITALVNSMKTLGAVDGSGRVPDETLYQVLEDIDPKLLKELKDTASYFPAKDLVGDRTTVPVTDQSMARVVFDPRTFRRIDPFFDLMKGYSKGAETGMVMGPGTGSERAIEALDRAAEDIELMKRLGLKAQETETEEE